jgi:Cu-Zn family superoxide dismutase
MHLRLIDRRRAMKIASGTLLLAVASAAPGQQAPSARRLTATLRDVQGRQVGQAVLSETAAGTLVRLEIKGLPPGWHGVHLHAVGRCEPPFQSAGSHWDVGGHQHGFQSAQGGHAGDLPNVLVGPDSTAAVEFVASRVVLSGESGILDADGGAVVVHAGPDDYRSDPAGNSGGRIACGVLERS